MNGSERMIPKVVGESGRTMAKVLIADRASADYQVLNGRARNEPVRERNTRHGNEVESTRTLRFLQCAWSRVVGLHH